jgi:type I restriction enzyme S subunit
MEIKVEKNEWTKVRLGDVAFEYSKRINNPSDSEFSRFVGSSNIERWDFRLKTWESTESVTSAMKLFEVGDYLLVRRSLYASDFRERSPKASFSGVCSGDILTIKENPKYVSQGFLITILNSPELWKYIVANASGSITRRIKWKDLAEYQFLLPPKSEQVKLADLFWSIDESIEQLNIALNAIKKGQRSYWNDMTRNTSTIRVKDVAKISNGTTPSTVVEEYWENGTIPWLATGEVHSKFIHASTRFITKEAVEQKKSRIFPKESTLVAMVGQGKTRGTSAKLLIDSAINQNFACVTPRKIEPTFLFYALYFNYHQLRHISQGTNQLALNCELVGLFKIPNLEKLEQNKVSRVLLEFESVLKNLSSKIKSAKVLKENLIHKVF